MKNNTAMNFLNSIASQCPLTDERCNRTGQSPNDGLLWFIGKGLGGWGGVMVSSQEGEYDGDHGSTVWRFEDNSMVICYGDPSDFERTEDIQVEYYGVHPCTEPAPAYRTFRAGCGFGPGRSGSYRNGELIPFPKTAEVTPVEKVDAPILPVCPPPSAEMALNHEAAVAYLDSRKANAATVGEQLVWVEEGGVQTAQIYTAGKLVRLAEGEAHWARGELKNDIVLFSSYECFVAWALARFW